MQPADCAAAASAAGFRGDALVTIVAIAGRESGYNESAVGDVGIETAVWGPSVGLYQIRTLKAQTGTGSDRDINALMPGGVGDPKRQSVAAWTISGGGTNFQPWSTYKGLTSDQLNAARAAIEQAGKNAITGGSGSTAGPGYSSSGVGGDVEGLIDSALGKVVGADTFSGWLAEHVLRVLEVIGGAIVLAVAGIMLLDVIGSSSGTAGTASGLIGRSIGKARDLGAAAALAL